MTLAITVTATRSVLQSFERPKYVGDPSMFSQSQSEHRQSFGSLPKRRVGWPGSAFRAQGRERLPFALNPVHELPNRAKGPLLIRLNRLDIAWQPELTEIWLDEPSNPDQFAPKCVEKAFSLKSSSKQWWIVAKTHRLIMQWRRGSFVSWQWYKKRHTSFSCYEL